MYFKMMLALLISCLFLRADAQYDPYSLFRENNLLSAILLSGNVHRQFIENDLHAYIESTKVTETFEISSTKKFANIFEARNPFLNRYVPYVKENSFDPSYNARLKPFLWRSTYSNPGMVIPSDITSGERSPLENQNHNYGFKSMLPDPLLMTAPIMEDPSRVMMTAPVMPQSMQFLADGKREASIPERKTRQKRSPLTLLSTGSALVPVSVMQNPNTVMMTVPVMTQQMPIMHSPNSVMMTAHMMPQSTQFLTVGKREASVPERKTRQKRSPLTLLSTGSGLVPVSVMQSPSTVMMTVPVMTQQMPIMHSPNSVMMTAPMMPQSTQILTVGKRESSVPEMQTRQKRSLLTVLAPGSGMIPIIPSSNPVMMPAPVITQPMQILTTVGKREASASEMKSRQKRNLLNPLNVLSPGSPASNSIIMLTPAVASTRSGVLMGGKQSPNAVVVPVMTVAVMPVENSGASILNMRQGLPMIYNAATNKLMLPAAQNQNRLMAVPLMAHSLAVMPVGKRNV